MGLFDDMLKNNESLFINSIALDYDYIPKLVPFREKEQKVIASIIQPLFRKQNGKNLVIHGPPGIGKTVACKKVINELEENTDDILPIYINCWQKDTAYKIVIEMCDQLGYKFTQTKRTEDLWKVVKSILNKKSAVFVFDEVDKLQEFDFLYLILEEIYRLSLIFITNYEDWFSKIDPRIKSRLTPEVMKFNAYNDYEIREILKERSKYAFVPDVWENDAFDLLISKAILIKDIRTGLYMMRESGIIAEDNASKKITLKHVQTALEKVDQFSINNSENLDDESKQILDLIRSNSGINTGALFELYQNQGGQRNYKFLQRELKKLESKKFINLEKKTGGQGNTTIIKWGGNSLKTLIDY